MKNNFWKFLLILSLLLNFSLLGAAGYTYYKQSRHRAAAPSHCGPLGEHFFRELSLKPEQINLLQQKADGFHGLMFQKRQAVDQLRGRLFNLLRADAPVREDLGAVITRINKEQLEMQRLVVAHILEFKSLLNKDQQQKFLDLIEQALAKNKETLCP